MTTNYFEKAVDSVINGDSMGKEASQNDVLNNEDSVILSKLAAELGIVSGDGAPSKEGEVAMAEGSVVGANPTVNKTMDGTIDPQLAAIGGRPDVAAAGEATPATKPIEDTVVGDTKSKAKETEDLHNEAAVKATSTKSNEAVKTASQEKIAGEAMAEAFYAKLQKIAENEEYVNSLEVLKTAGLLEGKVILDDGGCEKTASQNENCLEKLASGAELSRGEVVSAAVEYVELAKEASLVEEQARVDAREHAAEAVKEASQTPEEKLASLKEDPEVIAAMKVLKEKNIIN